ncbi:MAG: hypothetical protein ACJ8E0_07510 [Sphingomicrobium sp.]
MRKFLLAGTALLALAHPAAGATRRHASDPRDAEIAALRAEVEGLRRRLDADETAQRTTALQAETAKQSAAAAQQQATTALTQSQKAQVPAATPVPPLATTPVLGWWGSTTIGGRFFLNVSSIHQTSTDLLGNRTENVQNGTQTELKRGYVTIDHKFDDTWSANITTDFRYNSNGTSKDVLVFVKKAWVQARINPALNIRVGESDTPWMSFVESLYGYRFVENTLIDRTKFGASTDWGVHVFGTLAHTLVTYQFSAINGAGYKTLSRNSNGIDLEGRIAISPVKDVTLGVGGYSGKLGKSNDTVDVNHRATRLDAVVAYTDKRVRAGVEYFAASNWNNITTAPLPLPAPSTPNDKSNGWSAFGSYAVMPKVSVFGRYDRLKPSRDLNPSMRDNYFNVGLDYKPIKPIDLALVYKHEQVTHGLLSTSNGTIGGPDRGSYDEIGLFAQLGF